MKSLLPNEATFNRAGMTTIWNTHVRSLNNPHTSMEAHFQSCFLVKIWSGVIGNHVIGLFVLEEHLTSECYCHFLEDELPLLEDVHLHIR
jgi:hypothetical protein